MAVGHAIDHIGEPSLRIEAVEFGAFQHGVEDCGTLAAGIGSEKQKVLAGNGNAAQGTLGDVIVNREPAIAGIAGQRLPAAQRILDRFSERVL